MIKEALEKLFQMFDASRSAGLLDKVSGPREATYEIGGEVKAIAMPTPPRAHRLDRIVDLAAAVSLYGVAVTVWCSLKNVVAVLSDKNDGSLDSGVVDPYRLDKVSMPITPSTVFDSLKKLDEQTDQKDLIRFLTHDLYPCAFEPENFVATIRSLRMESGSVATGDFTPGKDSISRSVRAEITGANDIPQELVLSFLAFPSLKTELDSTVSVACSVYVDASAHKIVVSPLPGEVDAAITSAVAALQYVVGEAMPDGVKVFCGSP